MKITILGTGAYGLSLGMMANQNQMAVTLYTPIKEEYETLITTYQSPYLKNISLPRTFQFGNDLKNAVKDAKLILIATPTQYLVDLLNTLKPYIEKDQIIIIGSKGVLSDGTPWIHEKMENELKGVKYGILAGPSFAKDIAQNMPIELTLATLHDDVISLAKKALETKSLSIEKSSDLVGVELCGVLKNIFAIGAGIIHGLGVTESTKAFYFRKAVCIVKDILKKSGCQEETVFTDAGIGDIFLTLSNPQSRNYQYGVLLGSKVEKEIINQFESKNTIEGRNAIRILCEASINQTFTHPMLTVLYQIIFEKEDPEILIKLLYSI